MFPNYFISGKYKTVQSFKPHFPLCSYTLLPATVNVLETFLEAILLDHFQLFRRILNDINSITKHRLFEGTGKNELEPGQESMGMLQCYHTVC